MNWSFSGSAPIYLQLMDTFKLAIASGKLPPGSRLPAVRDLALEAGVNPNTMQRALAELERDGLLYTQRTSGRFVTEDAATVGRVKQELALQRLTEFLDYMSRLGLSKGEIITLIEGKEEHHGDTGM